MENGRSEDLIILWIWIGIGLLLLTTTFVTILILGYIKNIKKNKRKAASLIDRIQTRYGEDTLYLQERDRERLAEEIHDNIISRLNILRLNVNYRDMTELHTDLKKSMQIIREFSHQLTPPDLSEIELADLISDYLEEVKTSICVEYYPLVSQKKSISNPVKLNTFRIFQELVNNILKHANATLITVSLRISKNYMILMVYDNGSGFSLEQKAAGIGLRNIQLRAKQIGATYKYKSGSRQGTQFIILANI